MPFSFEPLFVCIPPLCLKKFCGAIFQTKKKRNLFFTALFRKFPEGKAVSKAVFKLTSIGSQRLATFPKGESKDNAGITKQAKPPKGKPQSGSILIVCLFKISLS